MRTKSKNIVYKVSDIPKDQLKDSSDCHKIPFLDDWIGERATIVTSKGIVKGRLAYMDGWYYCQAPFKLVKDNWIMSPYRFCFRKGQFRSIELESTEGSSGV